MLDINDIADEFEEELKEFQKATVRRVLKRFVDEGQKRMLVADEVGMGKTKVAKSVLIGLLKEHLRHKNKPFRCVYVCNNAAVARKNIGELTEGLDIAEKANFDRLSMAAKQIASMKNDDKILQLIPLTPSTSFTIEGYGKKEERELIYSLLQSEIPEIKSFRKAFEKKLNFNIIKTDTIKKTIGNDDIAEITREVRELLSPEKSDVEIVSGCRKIFAKIGLKLLKPDFVIMDEFQKFTSLLNPESESGMMAEKFFEDKNLPVLLLSATPYPKYSTDREIDKNGERNDFSEVFAFLTNGESETKIFNADWKKWSDCFKAIMESSSDMTEENKDRLKTDLISAKNDLETIMYKYVCRTERGTATGKKEKTEPKVQTEDILAHIEAQKILDEVNKNGPTVCRTFPSEYTKSCPYALSFMGGYKLQINIEDKIKDRKNYPCQWLTPNLISNYKLGRKPYPNAAFREMISLLFEKAQAEKLLWVPPSLPYYQPKGVFKGQDHFTKTLVFSSWAMVPKMLACLLTYEAERRNKQPKVFYSNENTRSIKITNKFRNLLIEPNDIETLADCYHPADYYGQPLRTIIDRIRNESTQENGDENLSALAAIASPAVCLYRTFKRLFGKKIDNKKIWEIAEKMIQRFSTPVNRCLIEAAFKNDKTVRKTSGKKLFFGEKLLWYCACGNFQAMIDEYAHMLKPSNAQDLYDKMMAGLDISATTYKVSVNDGRYKVKTEKFKMSLRSLFATAFAEGDGVKETNRKERLGDAFNSPFRPFVLASTSVGQEGLDFHKYCRRIVHWNLSDNPIDFEQREGRVNRYKNLSVRQKLAVRYGQILQEKDPKVWNDVWNALFDKAAKEETTDGDSGLIPYWILKDGKDKTEPEIESKVFIYPFGKEEQKFEQLNDRLLYHVVFGQKRQEELVGKMREIGLKNEDVKELMFNLSPFSRSFQGKVL